MTHIAKRPAQRRARSSIFVCASLAAGLLALTPAASGADCAIANHQLSARLADVAANHCPQAHAGADLPIGLDGSAALDATGSSDPDGDRLQYAWRLISSPSGSLAKAADPNSARTSFTPDLAGDYEFEVTVTDARGAVSRDSVRYSTANVAPVANAGDDLRVRVGEWVTLNAQRSYDANDGVLKYQWRLIETPAGSKAAIASSRSAPEFFVDLAGDYIAELVVSDGATLSIADTVRISTNNTIPVASAGANRRYAPGSTVQLNGSASRDADNDALAYRWSVISAPEGSAAFLGKPEDRSPTIFLADAGLYVFQLIVDDGDLVSAADTVAIELVADRMQNVDPKDFRHMVSRGGGDDTDGDGVLDLDDNCVLVPNAPQRDTDGDGIGNFCDADLNNDGIVNAIDLGLFKSVFFTNDPDADFDGNGIVNTIDLGRLKLSFFLPPGPAGLIIWVSLVDGDFANKDNWQPAIVPSAGSAALINVGTDVVVTSTSDNINVKTITNEETLALSFSTLEATGSIENGGIVNLTNGTTINNTLFEPSMSGTGPMNLASGTYTWNSNTLAIPVNFANGAIVNNTNGLTVNDTVSMDGFSVPTGLQFTGDQTLSGTGTIDFVDGNSVITEQRIFPGNFTTLTIDPGLTVSGADATVGNVNATIIMNGNMLADTAGRNLRLTGVNISGSPSLTAINGGGIEISGNYDNGVGAPVSADTAGGSITMLNGSALRNLTFNGQPGTVLNIALGTHSMEDVVFNAGMSLINGSIVNVTDGLVMNGTATIDAPSVPTGFQTNNDMTISGTGTFNFVNGDNSVITEPRLFPGNFTTLTVGSGITVRGGNATIGQPSGNLIFNGTLISELDGEAFRIGGTTWSASQSMQATNNGEVRFFGNLNNADAPIALDMANGTLSVENGITMTDVTLDGTAGTSMDFPFGNFTMTDVTADLDMSLVNGSIINVADGLTFNGTATIDAPSVPTGFQFTNSQTLAGTGTFDFINGGNTVITEPRLFPGNFTTLTVDSGITVRGGNATIGQPSGNLVFNGNIISELPGETFSIGGTTWSVSQTMQATGGGEFSLFGTLNNLGGAFTLDAPGTVTEVTNGTAIRNAIINGSATTRIEFLNGTTTLENLTVNADMLHINAAISNISNGLTLNGTGTIQGASQITGYQFNNDMSLLGTATIDFDSDGNSVITEPRIFPGNFTTLTIGPNVSIVGATGTVGNASATMVINGSVTANTSGEEIQVIGAWSGNASIAATNGGEMRLGGTLDNGGNAVALDAAGGTLNVLNGAIMRNAILNGTPGTVMTYGGGSDGTLENIVLNTDVALTNASLVQLSGTGITANGTISIDAPSQITGLQFNSTQTLGGTGEIVFTDTGNSTISEPRLFPGNFTTLTIGADIEISGGVARIGQASATLVIEGTISADTGEFEVLGTTVTNNGLLEALNGNTLNVDNLTAGATGELHVGAGSTIELQDDYAMVAGSITSIDIDDPVGAGPGLLTVAGDVTFDGTANISAVNGFSPAVSDSFVIVTHDDFSGSFSTVNSNGLGGGESFAVGSTMTETTATVQ